MTVVAARFLFHAGATRAETLMAVGRSEGSIARRRRGGAGFARVRKKSAWMRLALGRGDGFIDAVVVSAELVTDPQIGASERASRDDAGSHR